MEFLLTFSIILFLILLWLVYSYLFGAEYFPTGKRKIEKMLKMARVTRKDIVYDLGCGTGNLVVEASKVCKKAIGIEIDPIRFMIARLNILVHRRKNAKIILGNFFKKDISDATVVLVFLRAGANNQLKNKLKKIKKLRVVSHYWKFKDWKPVKQDKKLTLYLYKVR